MGNEVSPTNTALHRICGEPVSADEFATVGQYINDSAGRTVIRPNATNITRSEVFDRLDVTGPGRVRDGHIDGWDTNWQLGLSRFLPVRQVLDRVCRGGNGSSPSVSPTSSPAIGTQGATPPATATATGTGDTRFSQQELNNPSFINNPPADRLRRASAESFRELCRAIQTQGRPVPQSVMNELMTNRGYGTMVTQSRQFFETHRPYTTAANDFNRYINQGRFPVSNEVFMAGRWRQMAGTEDVAVNRLGSINYLLRGTNFVGEPETRLAPGSVVNRWVEAGGGGHVTLTDSDFYPAVMDHFMSATH